MDRQYAAAPSGETKIPSNHKDLCWSKRNQNRTIPSTRVAEQSAPTNRVVEARRSNIGGQFGTEGW